MADLTDKELADVIARMGGPESVASSRGLAARMAVELIRTRSLRYAHTWGAASVYQSWPTIEASVAAGLQEPRDELAEMRKRTRGGV